MSYENRSYSKTQQKKVAGCLEQFKCSELNSHENITAEVILDSERQVKGCDIKCGDTNIDVKTRIGNWTGRISMDIIEWRDDRPEYVSHNISGYTLGWLLDSSKITDEYVFYGIKEIYKGIKIFEYTIKASELKQWYLDILSEYNFTLEGLLTERSERDRLKALFFNNHKSEAPINVDDDAQRSGHSTLYICIDPHKFNFEINERTYIIRGLSKSYTDLLKIDFNICEEY